MAATATVGLLTPFLLPQDQGWEVMENGVAPLSVSTNGIFITSNTIGVPSFGRPPGVAVQWFYREIPIEVGDGFSIEFSLKVTFSQFISIRILLL